MERVRFFDAIIVGGGIVAGCLLPGLFPGLFAGWFARPSAPVGIVQIVDPTPTVGPALTFTPMPPSPTAERPIEATTTTTATPSTVSPTSPNPLPSATSSRPSSSALSTPVVAAVSSAPPTPTVPSAVTPSIGASPTAFPSASSTVVPLASPTPVIYVVQTGDTIDGIARTFGSSADAIVAANGLTDPNQLAVGQKLVIPPK